MKKLEIYGQEEAVSACKLAIEHDYPSLLVGETGTGKTSIIRYLSHKANKTFYRFNLTGETTVEEIVGRWTLNKGSMVWQDGLLVQAMKEGANLLIDEINTALPEVLFSLQSLLDDDKYIILTNKNNEKIIPHKNFRFFASMNPTDEYAGTKELNKAFMSRFTVVINVPYPPFNIEKKIVEEKGGAEPLKAEFMVSVAEKLRESKKNEDIFYTCSTRDLIYWATLNKHMDIKESFMLSIANKASEEDKVEILRIFNSLISKFTEIEKEIKESIIGNVDKDSIISFWEEEKKKGLKAAAKIKDEAVKVAKKIEKEGEIKAREMENDAKKIINKLEDDFRKRLLTEEADAEARLLEKVKDK